MENERIPLEVWLAIWMKVERFKSYKKQHDKKYKKKKNI